MKDVCKRTGLTERTVRYYVEEGLIQPEVTLRSGREYRDYSERDIEELLTIAGLRKLFFTIDEIKDMQNSPDRIAEVLGAYKLKMAADAKAKTAIVQALDEIDARELRDVSLVAEKLKSLSDTLPLPQRDINPDFGKFETGTKADREREYQSFLVRQAKQFRRGKIIVIGIAVINLLTSIVSFSLSFNFFMLIVQIVLTICLLVGVTWVRYLFAVGAGIAFLISIPIIMMAYHEGMALLGTVYVFYLLYSGVSCFLLFRSEAVSEYLYSQKNG